MYRAHYVRILIDELEEVLQTPTEAFTKTHETLSDRIVEFLQFLVDVLEYDANYPNYGYDQRSEGHGTQVKPKM